MHQSRPSVLKEPSSPDPALNSPKPNSPRSARPPKVGCKVEPACLSVAAGGNVPREVGASAGLRAHLGPGGLAREPTGPPYRRLGDDTASRIPANGRAIQEYRAAYGRLDRCVDPRGPPKR